MMTQNKTILIFIILLSVTCAIESSYPTIKIPQGHANAFMYTKDVLETGITQYNKIIGEGVFYMEIGKELYDISNKIDFKDKTFQNHSQPEMDKHKAKNKHIKQEVTDVVSFNRFTYVAHRGLSGKAPENTYPAFNLAIQEGYSFVETDILVTKDDFWVVNHDATVDRMTNGTGRIDKKTLQELQNLVIDNGCNISKYKNLRMPILEEFLDICKENNIHVFLDIKQFNTPANLDTLLEIIRNKDMKNNIEITGSIETINLIRQKDRDINVGPLIPINRDNVHYAKELGKALINCPKSNATKDNIELAHKNGIKVGVWTVDNPKEAEKLIRDGADYIYTDVLK